MDVNIRVAGEAGQGVHTVGDLLVAALAASGLHVLTSQSYMSRIRGGLNWYDIRIADRELWGPREDADLLVALIPEAMEELGDRVTERGVVVFDGESDDPDVFSLRFGEVAKEVAGNAIMANAVAAGAVFAILGYDLGPLKSYLRQTFARKGEEIVERNLACARRGAQLAAGKSGVIEAPRGSAADRMVVDGAWAVGLGAATAGVKFVCSYPMSPSTSVLNALASLSDEFGIVVEQAEDEISALNMVCGATYAGVPAMTTTSGGGFALMVEALSLAGMHELPAFILIGMRPGPATGLPTRTGQEDLKFAINAGHGEFPRAVFAPGTPQQSYHLTRHGLQLAHKYQTPVILLSDQFLLDLHRDGEPLDDSYRPLDRHLVDDPGEGYVRYAITDSGISPRAIPGGEVYVLNDSDEHTEDGHITERLDVRVQMVDKRLRKGEGMLGEAIPPERHGAGGAETLLVCWGSTYGPCREAVDILNEEGKSAAMLHFSQVWPLPAEAIREALRGRVVCVEGNARGQFASLLREVGALGECEQILKYNGMPFTGREIAQRVVE